MKKIKIYEEVAFFIGIVLLAFGTMLMAKADFGISMVVAPAYLLSLKVEAISFGVAEYILQAILLVALFCIIRKVKLSYCFSFATALFYGAVLDGFMALFSSVEFSAFAIRLVFYVIGILCCTFSVALLFHTYLPPEVYELFVKVVSKHFNKDIGKFKIAYDCSSCAVAVIMSLLFFKGIKGIGVGTIVCAFVNGVLISLFGKLLDKIFIFEPKLNLKKYFEEQSKN